MGRPAKKTTRKRNTTPQDEEELQSKANIHDEVKRQMAEVLEDDDEDFPEDEELNLTGPQAVRERLRHEDEIVIDDLIRGIPRGSGYYMMLYRELSPNNWEVKERIDHFHHWSDMEWEITSLVRKNTERNPLKWGSGRYRLIIKRDKGQRGEGYDPYDFIIDAGEGEIPGAKQGVPDVMQSMEAQMAQLAHMMGMIKQIMPQQQNPADIQSHIAQSFQQGMQIAKDKELASEKSNSDLTVAMIGMMREMIGQKQPERSLEDPTVGLARTIGMLKDMGMVGNQQPPPKDGLVEVLTQLKMLGIDPFQKQDPMDSFKNFKLMVSSLSDFMGAGQQERPGIAEKLVDNLIPVLPDVISNIKGLSDNYVASQHGQLPPHLLAQQQQIAYQPQQALPQPRPQPQYQEPPRPVQQGVPEYAISGSEIQQPLMGGISGGQAPKHEPKQQTPEEEQQEMMVKIFFNKLYDVILSQDQAFMPELTMRLQQAPGGTELIASILGGQANEETLKMLIQQWGGTKFQTPEMEAPILQYGRSYVGWLKQEAMRQQQALNESAYPNGAQQQPSQQPQQSYANGGSPSKSVLVGACIKCAAGFEYDNKKDFDEDNKICTEIDPETQQPCGGDIVLVQSQNVPA